MSKEEISEKLIWATSKLLLVAQGCTNHGCCFRDIPEGYIATNAVCRCMTTARELSKGIAELLEETTTGGEES